MELPTRAAKKITESSCTKEFQTGLAKGIANLGCKKDLEKGVGKAVGNRNCRKELPNAVAKGRLKRPVTPKQQELKTIIDLEAPLLDCCWDLHFLLF